MPTVLFAFRFALRSLWRRPSFAAGVTTLALGIGVTTAVAVLVDAVMFRPLPFPPTSERLVIASALVALFLVPSFPGTVEAIGFQGIGGEAAVFQPVTS